MMDLPKGFPMYCNDLKQMFDEVIFLKTKEYNLSIGDVANIYKRKITYPKQTNGHNALADAKWNFELYKFLQTI